MVDRKSQNAYRAVSKYPKTYPAGFPTGSFHEGISGCKQSTKASCECCYRKENGRSDSELRSLVPDREVAVNSREQTGLDHAQKKNPSNGQSREIVDKAHTGHNYAPKHLERVQGADVKVLL